MTSWHLNIWQVKIWLSQEQKELSKLNKKILVLKTLYFRHTKQTSKNIVGTNFKACARYFSFFSPNDSSSEPNEPNKYQTDIYIYIYIYIYSTRHFFNNSDISNLTNLGPLVLKVSLYIYIYM